MSRMIYKKKYFPGNRNVLINDDFYDNGLFFLLNNTAVDYGTT